MAALARPGVAIQAWQYAAHGFIDDNSGAKSGQDGAQAPTVRSDHRENMVPGAGIEPAWPSGREILSLLCLPISPSGHSEGSFEVRNCIRARVVTQFGFCPATPRHLPGAGQASTDLSPCPCRCSRRSSAPWEYRGFQAPGFRSRLAGSGRRCFGSGGSRQRVFSSPE